MEDKKWKPIRVREDKTKIYKKGVFTKTANSLVVAVNIWRSINNPISKEMITGGIDMKDGEDLEEAKKLDADDIYYSRSIPRKTLLSYNMITFHNIGINDMLFTKVKKGGSVLEMACGQASDLHRWLSSGLKFVLGVDIVKDNIYNAKNGAYARVVREYSRSFKQRGQEQVKFPDIAFAVGDCTLDIRSGEAGMDEESKKLLKMIMKKDNKRYEEHYKNIVGKGADKFDAITCLFAIHYFFENKKKLDCFLNNVSSNLKTGGLFMATFMDGGSVEKVIEDAGGRIAEGRKIVDEGSIPIWAIIKRFDDNDEYYHRKVDIFIENTQRLIPEYLVNYDFLMKKALEFDLEIVESELYSTTFEKFKMRVNAEEDKQTSIDKIILELDKQEIQKKFSSLNRWAIFKKIEK
jgi:SAM-dependent methyltransferase